MIAHYFGYQTGSTVIADWTEKTHCELLPCHVRASFEIVALAFSNLLLNQLHRLVDAGQMSPLDEEQLRGLRLPQKINLFAIERKPLEKNRRLAIGETKSNLGSNLLLERRRLLHMLWHVLRSTLEQICLSSETVWPT